MIDELLRALIASPNEASDDVLIDALRIGTPAEQTVVLAAILARKNNRSLQGVLELYERLPEALHIDILAHVKLFHGPIREAARGENVARRLAAIKIIAQGRQGKLAYVLSENLRAGNDEVAKAAASALHALARWISRSIRRLQLGPAVGESAIQADEGETIDGLTHAQIIENRPEIEAAVVRALEVHRGTIQQELLNAAMLLCDHAQAPAIGVLTTSRHGGQSVMVRRIQQVPEAEHVRAFFLGATHGHLRAHFGVTFAKIDAPAVLEAILRQTHWLKDAQLQLCVRQITQGTWWGEGELSAELTRRSPAVAAQIAEWITRSGVNDEQQDAKLERILIACGSDFPARLAVFRAVADRPRGTTAGVFKRFLRDPDDRLARMAIREIIRRKPADYENVLLPLMTDPRESVRRIVSRAIGQQGFETFWTRYDRMDKSTRRAAGKAMLKLLPDAPARLARRLHSGSVEQRVKALGMVRELDLVETMKANVVPLCAHANPRVRSKAITVLGSVGAAAMDVLIEKVVHDVDPRVRANAIEVMEHRGTVKFVPLLTERGQHGQNRERANAIKALHAMKVGVAAAQLLGMMRDERPEHRVSALWALRKIGWWRMLAEVARLAKEDGNVKVRQYAMNVLQSAAGEANEKRMAG